MDVNDLNGTSHTRPVVRIQLLMQSEDGGDAADVVGEGLGFVAGEGAAEKGTHNAKERLCSIARIRFAISSGISLGFISVRIADNGIDTPNLACDQADNFAKRFFPAAKPSNDPVRSRSSLMSARAR